jgi:hypothetical protein
MLQGQEIIQMPSALCKQADIQAAQQRSVRMSTLLQFLIERLKLQLTIAA